jgi:hypothetical protein
MGFERDTAGAIDTLPTPRPAPRSTTRMEPLMHDAIDVLDLRREVAHRADDLQREASHWRLRAEGRRNGRSRLASVLRRTAAAVDGRRAF